MVGWPLTSRSIRRQLFSQDWNKRIKAVRKVARRKYISAIGSLIESLFIPIGADYSSRGSSYEEREFRDEVINLLKVFFSTKSQHVVALINLLSNKNYLVRQRSSVALGALGDIKAIEPLKSLSDDLAKHEIHAITTESYAKKMLSMPIEKALKEVQLWQTLIYDEYYHAKSSPRYAVIEIEHWQTFMKKAIEALSNHRTAGDAATFLGNFGDVAAFDALLCMSQEYLESHIGDWRYDSELRAVEALGKLGDKRALPHLTIMYKSGDTKLREAAALGLGALGNTSVVEMMLNNIMNLDSRELHGERGTIEALAVLGDKRSIKSLSILLEDDSINTLDRNLITDTIDMLKSGCYTHRVRAD